MEFKDKLLAHAMGPEEVIYLNDMHPFDLVELYESVDASTQSYLITLLSEDSFAAVLSYLDPERAALFLERMELSRQQSLLNLIDPDDAADIIAELSDDVSAELVSSLGEENKAVALLKYHEELAGAMMNNLFVTVSLNDDVKEATRKVIKMAGDVSSIQTIFVTNEKDEYLGQFPLKTLLKAKPPLRVSDIITHETTFLDTTPLDDVVSFMKEFSDHDIAIVNDRSVLVGVITASDIIEEFHAEAIEDFSKLSALPEIDFTQGIFKSAIKRLPWLLGLLALSIVIALITAQFEAVIQATVALAFFQPLILDVGGDVASQTLAVTLIALNKEDSDLKKTGRKEVISGLITGVGLALVAFIITYLFGMWTKYSAPLLLATVVSVSLIVTVIIGFMFGLLVPILLHKIKLDPAVASGPFITTSIDILSLLVYFSLALLIL